MKIRQQRPLKVAMVSHGYFPRIGGAERLLRGMAARMKAQHVEPVIITRQLSGVPDYEEIDGIPVYRLGVFGPKVLASLLFSFAALRLIKTLQPDLVHAHELISPSTVALLAKRHLGIPALATVHRSGPLGDVQRMKARLLGNLRLKTLTKNLDAFVAISDETEQELRSIHVPDSKRIKISNGVDPKYFSPLAHSARQQLRNRYMIPSDAIVFIFTGRLSHEKRIGLLVDVWKRIQQHSARALLLIVGDGPDRAMLESKAGSGIRFLGKQDEVLPFLQLADAFVLPSVAEGLSIALLEAMSCGLVPVATSVGGALEVVESGINGLLVAPDDPTALGDVLTQVIADPEHLQHFGQYARQTVIEKFSLAQTVEQYLSLYQRLAKASA